MIGSVLSRYIAARFLVVVAVILGSALTLMFLVNLTETLRNYGDEDGFTFATGLLLTSLHTPAVIDDLLPFVCLFAAMITLLNLSRKLELVVARATGVSAWRFLLPVLIVAIALGVLSATVVNPVATDLRARAHKLEATLSGGRMTAASQIWFRQNSIDGSSILGAAARDSDTRSLINVRAFLFSPQGDFREKVEAKSARYEPGVWRLSDALILTAELPPQPQDEYLLPTDLTAVEFEQALEDTENATLWTLPGLIQSGRNTGRNIDALTLDLNALLARPLFFVAMIAIAGTVSLRLFRYGGIAKLALSGISAGFLLYVFTKIVHDLGGNGIISPVVAGWMPPIIAVTFGATMLLIQEDG